MTLKASPGVPEADDQIKAYHNGVTVKNADYGMMWIDFSSWGADMKYDIKRTDFTDKMTRVVRFLRVGLLYVRT